MCTLLGILVTVSFRNYTDHTEAIDECSIRVAQWRMTALMHCFMFSFMLPTLTKAADKGNYSES